MEVKATITEEKVVKIEGMTLAKLIEKVILAAYGIPSGAYIDTDGFLTYTVAETGKSVLVRHEVLREATEDDKNALAIIHDVYNYLARKDKEK